MPPDHPLRAIRLLVNAALERLSGDYDQFYASGGRDPITAEKLQRALLLQAFHSVRSERRLMEQAIRNMLFRWSIGLSMDAPVRDMAVFTENRDRPPRGGVAGKSFVAVLAGPDVEPPLSSERFSVDGTPIEAWASMESVQPKDGLGAPPGWGCNGGHGFHGGKRRNETHASTTDPDARSAASQTGGPRSSAMPDMR